MTQKELKRLSRAELLELLLVQTREVERLREELAQTREELAQRRLRLEQAGDLATAVVMVNQVMEAAQAAADQYLDNIRAMEEETRQKCGELLRAAREEAQTRNPAADPGEPA